jgi:succinyl-CoA synthetase beta subunit
MSLVKKRFLSLLEFQAKQLLSEYGVNVQKFIVASGEPMSGKSQITTGPYIIKAQIAAGGRGKGRFLDGTFAGSGIQFRDSFADAMDIASMMRNKALITAQTPPQGEIVKQVMIAEAVPKLQNEGYLAFTLKNSGPVILASARGGVDIEQVPRDEIFEFPVENSDLEGIVKKIFPNAATKEIIQTGKDQLMRLQKCFFANDLTLLEINPFAITPNGQVICIDAKVEIDDNALFRQTQFKEIKKEHTSDNFVKLEDGNIGIVVNGAGLAMATMDLIKLNGAKPANFLDLGGKATAETIAKEIQRVEGQGVAGILVNIFGGIVRCDEVARGLIESGISCPIVARLCGKNDCSF